MWCACRVRLCLAGQEVRRISLAARTPELARKINAPADSKGTRGMPPVSGSSFFEPDGADAELLMALEGEALAEGLAVALADALVEADELAEALDIGLALEVGLAIILASVPLSSILPLFIPMPFIP
jgi:hypothetical protein